VGVAVLICWRGALQADVFSFGAVAYELMSYELLATAYIGTARGLSIGIREPDDYVQKVWTLSACALRECGCPALPGWSTFRPRRAIQSANAKRSWTGSPVMRPA
jgi:hypothetical protein